MRKQQRIWEEEHLSPNFLPNINTSKPSSSLFWFFKNNKDLKSGKVADLGSGKGRNAVYLAKLGFEVYCIDYIQTALDTALELASKEGVADKIHTVNAALDEEWPFEDNFFDFELDCFSSIDIETLEGRKTYLRELKRTLKVGGYGLIAVVSTDDEIEKELMKKYPGPEKNSAIWPGSGKYQKNYTEEELRNFYSDFKIVKIQTVDYKEAFKLDKSYTAKNIFMIIKK